MKVTKVDTKNKIVTVDDVDGVHSDTPYDSIWAGEETLWTQSYPRYKKRLSARDSQIAQDVENRLNLAYHSRKR
jgi:hypothetical protein